MTEGNINQWYAECIAAREEYRTEAAMLRAQVETLRESLRPFATAAETYEPDEGDDYVDAWDTKFTIGDLRRAARALAETKTDDNEI